MLATDGGLNSLSVPVRRGNEDGDHHHARTSRRKKKKKSSRRHHHEDDGVRPSPPSPRGNNLTTTQRISEFDVTTQNETPMSPQTSARRPQSVARGSWRGSVAANTGNQSSKYYSRM